MILRCRRDHIENAKFLQRLDRGAVAPSVKFVWRKACNDERQASEAREGGVMYKLSVNEKDVNPVVIVRLAPVSPEAPGNFDLCFRIALNFSLNVDG